MVLITRFILCWTLQSHCWAAFAQWIGKHAHTQCKAGNSLLLSLCCCSDPKRRKSNAPGLFLEVMLVFAAFDLMNSFGLILLLPSLPLLSHGIPGFLLLSCPPGGPAWSPAWPKAVWLCAAPQLPSHGTLPPGPAASLFLSAIRWEGDGNQTSPSELPICSAPELVP